MYLEKEIRELEEKLDVLKTRAKEERESYVPEVNEDNWWYYVGCEAEFWNGDYKGKQKGTFHYLSPNKVAYPYASGHNTFRNMKLLTPFPKEREIMDVDETDVGKIVAVCLGPKFFYYPVYAGNGSHISACNQYVPECCNLTDQELKFRKLWPSEIQELSNIFKKGRNNE